jgi:hypothetical protein
MSAKESRRESATTRQAREDGREQLAGITAAFQQAAEMGPGVFALQKALLQGIALGQRREAKRLAAHNADDPRLAVAIHRAEQAVVWHEEATRAATAAGRFVGGLHQGGIFHGYVVDAAGTAAEGYVVQVAGDAEAVRRQGRKPRATAGADGYFRFDLQEETGTDPGSIRGRRTTFGEMSERFAPAAEALAALRGAADQADQSAHGEVEVEVFDPNGRAVFRDPSPPTLSGETAEFRYYLIPAAPKEGTSVRTAVNRAAKSKTGARTQRKATPAEPKPAASQARDTPPPETAPKKP